MIAELLLMATTFAAIAFTAYWTGRRHGEAERAYLIEDLDFQQDLINAYEDERHGRPSRHPALRNPQD